ncbi:MAG: hypothetical protein R3213_00430 [Flavobacteriaceae bacterium]|nr:hypothetical protein [Flavobacteriaceae bacterium]
MLVNTTYNNKENTELINEVVGRPYSLLERIKLGGVGSKRMIVEEVSLGFKQLLNTVADINYANIELRPSGILVMINKGLQNFTWVIPYFHLAFFKTSQGSIHSEGRYLRFRKNRTYKENKKFFDKMMEAKIKFDRGKSIDDFYQSRLQIDS